MLLARMKRIREPRPVPPASWVPRPALLRRSAQRLARRIELFESWFSRRTLPLFRQYSWPSIANPPVLITRLRGCSLPRFDFGFGLHAARTALRTSLV